MEVKNQKIKKNAMKIIKHFTNHKKKLFDDYSRNVSESKYRIKYGEGLKILTPKQMLQR